MVRYLIGIIFLFNHVYGDSVKKETPKVCSFDIFDTLLGRLHYDPHSVFQLVEENYPYPNFTSLRKLAEQQSNGTLEDIYQKFQLITNISEEKAKELMNFELETELAHIFPIVENIKQVKDGDFLISDTYYNLDHLKRILEKVGLNKTVQVFCSPAGKSSGNVWKYLSETAQIEKHLGDNHHSDVVMAVNHNIPAVHYQDGDFSPVEELLANSKQKDLACAMRAVRLQNPYPSNSVEYLLWNEQTQFNIPILVQASLYLNEFCKVHDKNRVLFSSRGACLWMKIFQTMFPEYTSIYFHSSRHVYRNPTPSYIEYVRSIYTENTVIVDEGGSGNTCTAFFHQYFNTHPTYLAIIYERLGTAEKPRYGIEKCLLGRFCAAIELVNHDYVGSLQSFEDGKPIRIAPEIPFQYVDATHSCVDAFLKIYSAYKINSFDRKVFDFLMRRLQTEIVSHKYLPHMAEHFPTKPAS